MTAAVIAPAITISDRAAQRIADFLRDDSALKGLRIGVAGGGCSGFKYEFDLTGDAAPDDLVVRNGAAVVLIDPVSIAYMEGSEVDLVENLMGESFQVKNPLAIASCGCGTSFAL